MRLLIENPWLLVVAASVFGLIVGSFLNVVILRLPARLMHDWKLQSRDMLDLPAPADEVTPPGIVVEGSHCPKCKHALGPLDNIPVLSWVFLRGRCRYCKAPISAQYPFVELLTAFAAGFVAWRYGWSWQCLAGLGLTFALIALAGIDAHTQLLPDNITLPLLWAGLLLGAAGLFVGPVPAILGAAIGYLSLWSVYWAFKLLTGKEGMGYGDFKLLGALGAWMGPQCLLPIILLSSIIGAVVGAVMLARAGKDHGTPIPFGPFIAAAGWVQFVWDAEILALFARFFSLH